MSNKPSFTIGCFAVIFDDKKVLLAHRRDKDLWVLPGGAMESGETPYIAVKREVLEETGLVVNPDRFIGLYCKPAENDIVLAFTCKVTGGALTLNDEADRLEYFLLADIPTNTNQKHVGRIKDALSTTGESLIREQL